MNQPTPEDVQYGKIITTETIHGGGLTSYQIEVAQKSRPENVLSAIIEALGLIKARKTRKLTLVITADEDYNVRDFEKLYTALVDKTGRTKNY